MGILAGMFTSILTGILAGILMWVGESDYAAGLGSRLNSQLSRCTTETSALPDLERVLQD